MAFIEAKGDESITADGVTFNSRVLRGQPRHAPPLLCRSSARPGASWRPGLTRSGICSLHLLLPHAINEAVLHAAMITFIAHN